MLTLGTNIEVIANFSAVEDSITVGAFPPQTFGHTLLLCLTLNLGWYELVKPTHAAAPT